MATREQARRFKVAVSLDAQSIAAAGTVTGTAVDTAGFEAATIIVRQGAKTSTWAYVVEHSDQLAAGYSNAVTDGAVIGTLPADSAANTTYKLAYVGFKRYVRVSVTAGATPTGVGVGLVVLGDPREMPQA